MKSFIKSAVLYGGYLLHRSRASKVIYYHDVSAKYTDMGTPVETFKKHLDVIKESDFSIVDNITEPHNQIMICFDDGWTGLYENMDLFISQNIFPTTFLAVDLISKNGYMNLNQILELQALGFHFECHTWSHSDLPFLDDKQLKYELFDSKKKLEQQLQKNIDAICFPRGLFSDRVIDFAIEAGYEKLYSSISGSYFKLLGTKKIICRNLVQYLSPKNLKFTILSESPIMTHRSIKLHYKRN